MFIVSFKPKIPWSNAIVYLASLFFGGVTLFLTTCTSVYCPKKDSELLGISLYFSSNPLPLRVASLT